MEGTDTIVARFRRRILGQYPAVPCSPGPFVLLPIYSRFRIADSVPLGSRLFQHQGRHLRLHSQNKFLTEFVLTGYTVIDFIGFEKGLADRGGWRKEIPRIP